MPSRTWFVPIIVAGVSSGLGAVGSYYASGHGSGAADIAANEHRITVIEDTLKSHAAEDDRATTAQQRVNDQTEQHFRDVFFAINFNRDHKPPQRSQQP